MLTILNLLPCSLVPENTELEPGESYSAFYHAEVNDDVAFTSSWYPAVTTQLSTDGSKIYVSLNRPFISQDDFCQS